MPIDLNKVLQDRGLPGVVEELHQLMGDLEEMLGEWRSERARRTAEPQRSAEFPSPGVPRPPEQPPQESPPVNPATPEKVGA